MCCLAACGLFCASSQEPARAAGIHEEFGRFSSFLMAPQAAALDGRATRTDAPGHEAVLYTIGVRFPFRSSLLFQPEISYISLVSADDIENGFGDLRLRVRARAWADNGSAVLILGAVRAGTGQSALFPYATASVDWEGGLAFVDTVASLSWWLSAVGAYATRVGESLKQGDLHGNYATLGGGVVLPLTGRVDVRVGAVAYLPRRRPSREILFVGVDYRHSRPTALFAAAQAEGGREADRAVDIALAVGVRITY